MNWRSPTLEGFRTIFRQPSLGLAEMAWRWSFAVAAALLFAFSVVEYFGTLPVTSGELLLLRTRHPVLIAQAVGHILRGSAPRAMLAAIVLAMALAIAWIAMASLGRAATVKALVEYFREGAAANPLTAAPSRREHGPEQNWRPGSLLGLNFLRVGVTLAAAVSCLGAILSARFVSADSDPSPGRAMLVVFILVTLVGLSWSALNWFLSLAAIFAVSDRQDTFGAVASAVDLCRVRSGSLFAAGTWFGLAHLTVFVAASGLVAFPLAVAGVLPGAVVLGGVLLVMFLYFAVVDFLYVGRLAAYVAIVERPDMLVTSPLLPPPAPDQTQYLAPGAQPGDSVDPDELILSDLPSATS